MPDGLRLAIGTLTRLPVPPPRTVDRRTARAAMALAPVVGLVLGLIVGAAAAAAFALVGSRTGPVLVAALAVAAVAYATRAIHLDGLADTADALGSGRPAEAALEIARRSDIGPFGVLALVITLLVDTLAAGGLVGQGRAIVAIAVALMVGRLGLVLACTSGVPAARPDGLGATVAGTVPRPLAAAVVVAGIAVAAALGATQGDALATAAAAVGGLAVAGLTIRTATRRLGGVTGDVLGATVEIATAAVLVILVALPA
jgi:adenosylcobinamide-GDP ribazoletransferase